MYLLLIDNSEVDLLSKPTGDKPGELISFHIKMHSAVGTAVGNSSQVRNSLRAEYIRTNKK